MSLNDYILEGQDHMLGVRKMYSTNSRNKVHSLVGTKVVVSSFDGVPAGNLLCTLVEISERGFLFRVQEPHLNFQKGCLVFASTCSFIANSND